jgi:hypothetical protein
MKKLALLVAVMVMSVAGAFAMDSSIIKISLINPIYVPMVDKVTGLDIGIISAKTPTIWGLGGAWIYYENDDAIGLTSAIVNYSNKKMVGVQYGFYNSAEEVTGLQVGFINICNKMQGVQLGLVNNIKTGPLPWFVFINAAF